MKIKVLTYNIHGMPWANTDIKKIFTWVFHKSGADIVCLQEVWSLKQRKLLQEFCQDYGWRVSFPQDPCRIGYLCKGLECGSGLAILYKADYQILELPTFHPFTEAAGVDKIITKGFFHIRFQYKSNKFSLINTHFQSDFTEVPCCRVNYKFSRKFQEWSLYCYCKQQEEPIFVCGDLNQQTPFFFHLLESEKHITFPETGEHLDHICVLKTNKSICLEKSIYFDDVLYSDHIPVLFELDIA
jgi:exonuclease III